MSDIEEHPVVKGIVDHPIHAVAGAVIGQLLIPIPVVGAGIGVYVAGWLKRKK